ncbi:MAG TPA: choice-of-anchor L domain-containing protein, partial [Bacteroidia bacterium]|nr:choice-of-anchor L domain-containing protein [Bacteroidia bacterium]
MLRKSSRFLAVLIGMVSFGSMKAQLTTSNALTPTQLVQQVLLGPGITASNITYTGYANAIGWFHNGNSGSPGLGIDSGVVMTNGTILANDPTYGPGNGPQGPNNSPGAGVDNGQPGDPYLTTVAGVQTFNACVLEFDFVAQSDSVKFNYVFGTDEYMEYVSGGYADVFAFVLSGVTTTLAPTNIALIPSTTTPVTALNVNANVNSQYYVDNENPPGTTAQYDGFTVVLTAKYPILCGETYHIKLACADAQDGIVDGGVFLQAGSFTTGQVDLSTQISYGSNNDSTLYEGCGQACVILARQGNLALQDTVQLTVGGTATNGVDYIPAIPSQVIFQPGQDSIVLCLQAIQD